MDEISDKELEDMAYDLSEPEADWIAQFSHKLYREGWMAGFKEGFRKGIEWIRKQVKG